MESEENILDGYDVADDDHPFGKISQILYNTQEQCQMMQALIKNQIEVKYIKKNRYSPNIEEIFDKI